jgi:hypothetical protein
MPFRSEAQRRKFLELVKSGKISQEVFDEWNGATGKSKLPDRLRPEIKSRGKKSLLRSKHRKV